MFWCGRALEEAFPGLPLAAAWRLLALAQVEISHAARRLILLVATVLGNAAGASVHVNVRVGGTTACTDMHMG